MQSSVQHILDPTQVEGLVETIEKEVERIDLSTKTLHVENWTKIGSSSKELQWITISISCFHKQIPHFNFGKSSIKKELLEGWEKLK